MFRKTSGGRRWARPQSIPSYRKHKKSGQAVVTLADSLGNRRDILLGKHGTHASRLEYARAVGEWEAAGQTFPTAGALSVNELMLHYWRHAERYYRKLSGEPTDELNCQKLALRPVKELYGATAADNFGPLQLRTVRERMIGYGWCRRSINLHLSRIKHMFRWAGEHGFVKPEAYHRLLCVTGLQAGRSDAKESVPVKPVPDHLIDVVRPHVAPQVWAMIQLQLDSGARPGEISILRVCDLDTSDRVWIYRPDSHKTGHHGHERTIYLGPKQEIIKPWLKLDTQAFLFAPAEAMVAHRQELRKKRQTAFWPSHARAQKRKRRRRPKRVPGDHYDVASYRRAIQRACDLAFSLPEYLQPRIITDGKRENRAAWRARLTREETAEISAWQKLHRWHPHQLRHNAGTYLRKRYGVELARIILGHATAFTTEIYAEVDRQQAVDVMGQIG